MGRQRVAFIHHFLCIKARLCEVLFDFRLIGSRLIAEMFTCTEHINTC